MNARITQFVVGMAALERSDTTPDRANHPSRPLSSATATGHKRTRSRHRGVGAVLAMMFLVIFGSLAAAMAIVAQGNLQTAQTQLEVGRALSAAQTGLRFMIYRLNNVTAGIETRDGLISPTIATTLWTTIGQNMVSTSSTMNTATAYFDGSVLRIGPISVGPNNALSFTAVFTPHPITGENYDAAWYKQAPYDGSDPTSGITTAVSNTNPLDARFIRLTVTATAGHNDSQVTRSVSVDFRINKQIHYAILAKSRLMIGRNVMIDGPIGSSFTDVNLPDGHPIQMEGDFYGLDSTLDAQLDKLRGTLITNDKNGDNRININNPAETTGITDPKQYDTNGDGYIDAYDFFLAHYDTNADGKLSKTELDTANNPRTAELFDLIDDHGNDDGYVDNADRYAKVHGQAYISASKNDWNQGAAKATGAYQDYFQGPITPDHGQAPLTFDATTQNNAQQYSASDFDMSVFKNMTQATLDSEATAQAVSNPTDPSQPQMGTEVREAVPYGSSHPYDYYDRPVYKNMTFTNVLIPAGTNALFENCTFIGVTFVQSDQDNADPNYDYSGMQESDGYAKYPDRTATVDGQTVTNTKTTSNNIRFNSCTFEGGVATSAPKQFTQVRNKLQFTGATVFDIKNSSHLTTAQKQLFERSTLLAPNYSVEMGTFQAPDSPDQHIDLSGMIVAGIIDMRGNIDVNGSIITTFHPQNNTGPVVGDTSPDFNTTLGYFSSEQGDLESEIPTGGLGEIYIHYDPSLAMPDGILGPIEMQPLMLTYHEGGG